MNRHERRRAAATKDPGFEAYRDLVRRMCFGTVTDREIGEGWMRGSAAAVSGVDGMMIHPVGGKATQPSADDLIVSANFDQVSFKARVPRKLVQECVEKWPTTLQEMPERDERQVTRQFISHLLVRNQHHHRGHMVGSLASAMLWLASTGAAGPAALIGNHIHYELTEFCPGGINFRLLLLSDDDATAEKEMEAAAEIPIPEWKKEDLE